MAHEVNVAAAAAAAVAVAAVAATAGAAIVRPKRPRGPRGQCGGFAAAAAVAAAMERPKRPRGPRGPKAPMVEVEMAAAAAGRRQEMFDLTEVSGVQQIRWILNDFLNRANNPRVMADFLMEVMVPATEAQGPVLVYCEHGAHRSTGLILAMLVVCGIETQVAADHIEMVRATADVSSAGHRDRPSTRQRVVNVAGELSARGRCKGLVATIPPALPSEQFSTALVPVRLARQAHEVPAPAHEVPAPAPAHEVPAPAHEVPAVIRVSISPSERSRSGSTGRSAAASAAEAVLEAQRAASSASDSARTATEASLTSRRSRGPRHTASVGGCDAGGGSSILI